jgi:hypothetical protein
VFRVEAVINANKGREGEKRGDDVGFEHGLVASSE